MRPWLLAMLLITAVLAGCSESPPEDPSEDLQDAGDGQDPDDEGNGTQVPNTAPLANLTADVLNGTAPLLVNLTLAGSDADGDNLTWRLDHNGTQVANGTELPATLAFNLTAGNHTFLLSVSDGNSTAAANATIRVAAALEGEDPNAPVDMGTFIYDPATGMCHLKTYDQYGAGPAIAYNFDYWVFAETNGEPGLQVANNFLVAQAEDQGFAMEEWEICEDGDQMVF